MTAVLNSPIVLSEGTTFLGDIITWVAQKEVPVQTVQKSLVDNGLDVSTCRDILPQNAFKRACRQLKKDRVIRQVEKSEESIRFQFTREHLAGGRFEYDFECCLVLDLTTSRVTCDSNPELANMAETALREAMGVKTRSDVTKIIQRLCKGEADLFPINPLLGVAYFVPEEHKQFLDRVEKFSEDCGTKVWRFPIPRGTDSGNKSVRDAVKNGLQVMVDELKEASDEWDKSTRNGTVANATKRWETIRFKVDAYAEFLDAEKSALLSELDQAKAHLRTKAEAVLAAKEDDNEQV